MPDSSRWNRRRFLVVAGGTAVLAGCAGEEEGGPGDGADPGTDDEEEPDNEPAGDGDEDGDEDAGGEEGDDGSAEEQDGDDGGETTRFGDIAQFADSYAFDAEGTEEGEAFRWSGRVHGDDSYMRMEENGEVMEMYSLNDETYVVQGGECFRMTPGEFEGMEEGAEEPDLEAHEEEAVEQPSLEAAGRDTIDGEEVYVFELSADEAAEHEMDVTYYVSVETGYLRRVEYETGVVDFHSWGTVEAIEPPDVECTNVGDWDDDAWSDDGETPAIRLP